MVKHIPFKLFPLVNSIKYIIVYYFLAYRTRKYIFKESFKKSYAQAREALKSQHIHKWRHYVNKVTTSK